MVSIFQRFSLLFWCSKSVAKFQRSSMHIYIRSYDSLAKMVGFRRRRNVRIVQFARQVL
jgi:hypothetical protein